MKIPFYRQLSSNDCGLACLRMVAAYYGRNVSTRFLKSLCEISKVGITLQGLCECAEAIGFSTVPVKIGMNDIERVPCPAILYYKRGHFVVLEGIKSKNGSQSYIVLDPDFGRAKLSKDDLMDRWQSNGQGLILLLGRGDEWDNIEIPEEADSFFGNRTTRYIMQKIHDCKRDFAIIALLSLVVIVTNWAMPLILKDTIDQGIQSGDIGKVAWLLLFQFLFFIGYMISDNVNAILNNKVSIKVNVAFVSLYLHKILRLPMKFFDIGQRTDLFNRLSDQSRVSSFIMGNLLNVALAVINIIVFSVILINNNVSVFLIFVLFSALSIGYNQIFLRKRKSLDYLSFTLNSERSNTIREIINGMPDIKINSAQDKHISNWKSIEDKVNDVRIKSMHLEYKLSGGSKLISRLRDITITGICALIVIDSRMTLGEMMMISFILGQLASPVDSLLSFSRSFQDAKMSAERLDDVFSQPDEENDTTQAAQIRYLQHGIAFRNVTFRYIGGDTAPILNNICLEIERGKSTAIVGKTGCGKSTILKLILGFYKLAGGEIMIDGNDICDLSLNDWRKRCGVVMQDGSIFSGTIAENIAIADTAPDKDRLHMAVKTAELQDLIDKLPLGLGTKIGETGINLSGGEKQRILIARAVYRNPEVILFDEATSSLDAKTERRIMDNLQDFFNGKTVVIIAHRLSTVKSADKIIYIEDGKVAETGNHAELIARQGYYYSLVNNQLGAEMHA